MANDDEFEAVLIKHAIAEGIIDQDESNVIRIDAKGKSAQEVAKEFTDRVRMMANRTKNGDTVH